NSAGLPTIYDPLTGWDVGTLNSGASLTLQITTDVTALSGIVSNTATVNEAPHLDQPDTNPANNTDDAIIAISGLDLQVTKTVDNATPIVGDTLVYSITVQNFGPADATDVVLIDDLNILPLTYVTDNTV